MNAGTIARYAAQGALYAAFAAFIGYFSVAPSFSPIPDGDGLLRLSFIHPAQLKSPCRTRTAEELAKLPPNMRNPTDCQRERSPVAIELDMDGHPLVRRIVPPSGVAKDGAASVYHRQPVPAGEHRFDVRMSDGPDGKFNYVANATVALQPGRVLLIDFDPAAKGFIFRQ
jgi:hypothetical protein